jgi:hypothetical protein
MVESAPTTVLIGWFSGTLLLESNNWVGVSLTGVTVILTVAILLLIGPLFAWKVKLSDPL